MGRNFRIVAGNIIAYLYWKLNNTVMQLFRSILIAGTLAITTPALHALDAEAVKPVQKTAMKTPLAPQFSAKSMQGTLLSTQTLAGKAYIVNFFGSWCPYCRKEIPDMVALQEKYEKKGFTFIGMAYKDNEKSMPDFIREHGINYPVIMADEAILYSFGRQIPEGVRSVPTLFAISRDGRLVSVIIGAQTKEEFESIILETLKKPVR